MAKANLVTLLTVLTVVLLSGMPSATVAEPGLWSVDHGQSWIRFRAVQAGARFSGEIQEFDAQIRFDPDDLGGSSANVRISAASIDTADRERDDVLRTDEWFHVSRFPVVTFTATDFARGENNSFETVGQLGVKGLSVNTPFRFTVTRTGDRLILDGTATLDRLRLKLGVGEWADTAWIGQNVEVLVHVEAAVTDG